MSEFVRKRWVWATTAAAVCGVGVGFALAFAGGGGSHPSVDPGPPFAVAQHAASSASGVQLHLESAQFSGSATMLALSVNLGQPGAKPIRQIVIPRDAFAGASLQPLADPAGHATGTASAEFVLRMNPVAGPGNVNLQLSKVELVFQDGSDRAITGNWSLTVSVPADVSQHLAAQKLAPGPSASLQGVTASVAAAVRSETETLVTVDVQGPEGVQFLGVPTLTSNGSDYQGRLLSSPGGKTLTYQFPATPMGAHATLTLSAAVVPQSANADRYVDIDLQRAMKRDGLSGHAGDDGPLAPGDVVSTNAPALAPTELAFRPGSAGLGVAITLGSALTPGQFGGGRPALTLANGSVIEAEGVSTSFNHDATGAIVSGQSIVFFPVSPSELNGVARVSVGSEFHVLPGSWTIQLTPS